MAYEFTSQHGHDSHRPQPLVRFGLRRNQGGGCDRRRHRAIEGEVIGGPNFRGGVRGGIGIVSSSGVVRATGQYDGLGEADFRALTGKLELRMSLH